MPRTVIALALWVVWASWLGSASAQVTLYSPGQQSHYRRAQAQADLVQGLAANHQRNQEIRRAHEKGYLDTLHQVDKSAIPIPDTPPIRYPSQEKWRDLTARRTEKTKSADALTRSVPTSRTGRSQASPLEGAAKRNRDRHSVREICRLIMNQAPDRSAQTRAERFLQLSERRTWTDYAGRSIEATYSGHGADRSGRTRVWLMTPDGHQHAVDPQMLSSASQQDVTELGQIVPTIGTDLVKLRNHLAGQLDQQSNIDLQISAGFSEFPGGNSTFLQVGSAAQPGFVPSSPQGGLQEY